MAQNYFYPPAGSGSSNASIGVNGVTAPTSSTEVAGINPSGNLQPLKTDASGNLYVSLNSSTAEQSVNLNQVGGSAIAIGQALMAASLPVVIASNQSTLAISAASLPLPTGGSTSALQTSGNASLTSIDSKTPALGAAATAASVPVNIASDQVVSVIDNDFTASGNITTQNLVPTGTATAGSAVAISTNNKGTVTIQVTGTYTGVLTPQVTTDGTNWITAGGLSLINMATGAASATIPSGATGIYQIEVNGHAQFRITALAAVTGTAVVSLRAATGTSQISAAALPLPTGAATSALQTTGNTSLATIVTNTTGLATSANQTNASQKTQIVDGSGNVIASTSNALNVSAAITSSALPTGAATAANQTTANTSLATIATQTSHLPTALGQTTMANSLPVVFASKQTNLATSIGGKSVSNPPIYNQYLSSPVTTSAYVQLVASTASVSNMIEIFDSSGQSMILGVGAAGSEVIQLYTLPGGNGQVPLLIPAGSRVAIKALTANATSGYITINFYS